MISVDVEIRNAEKTRVFYLNDEMARKIDNSMHLLFDFIDHSLAKESLFFTKLVVIDPKILFYTFLHIFDHQILILNQTMFV